MNNLNFFTAVTARGAIVHLQLSNVSMVNQTNGRVYFIGDSVALELSPQSTMNLLQRLGVLV